MEVRAERLEAWAPAAGRRREEEGGGALRLGFGGWWAVRSPVSLQETRQYDTEYLSD